MLLTVYSTTTTIITLFLLLLLHFPCLSATHPRRFLHHPFFSPSLPLSPTQPPSPSPPSLSPPSQPKHPFSTSLSSPPTTSTTSTFSGDNPFFPSYPSSPPPPPPPSTTSFPTFPANISSLALPSSTTPASHSPVSSKLVIVIVLLSLLTLSLIVSFSLLLHRRNSKSLRHFPSQTPLSPPPLPPPPKLATTHRQVSHTNSEFLYVGNSLTNSRDFQPSSAIEVPSTSSEIYLKLCGDSPELRPLPPLPKKNSHVSFEQNFEEVDEQQTQLKHDEEEFYSPRSFSRRVFFDEDNFDNYGLNSSPARSYSDFPASDSDISVEIQTLAARTHHFPATGKVGPPAPPPPTPPGMGPPPLVPPSGPVVFKRSGNLEEKKSGQRKEEIMKPKLKALHWDKVRASSDRVMVWDQLKPGSFQ